MKLNKIIDSIWEVIKPNFKDPCNDPRCKGCVYIDDLICPYPKECSAMLDIGNDENS